MKTKKRKEAQVGYEYACGVCGWKYENRPSVCHCGNDAEFEELKNGINKKGGAK